MESDNIDMWQQLEEDDVFREFLSENFDVRSHATKAIQSLAIVEHLGKLTSGITLLDKELQSQVSAHHEDLLSQATGIEALEGVLDMMHTRIQSLQGAIERIRNKVVEPYNKIASRTEQLRRLQETCDMLRVIIRVLYLSKRLHGQLQGGIREITKAAQSLSELDYLAKDVDLSGIEVIAEDQRFTRNAHREVESQAHKLLSQGMESQNQTQVATALQVFFNLGTLQKTVEKVIADCRDNLHCSVQATLDIETIQQVQPMPDKGKGAPGRATMPAPGNTAQYRATLWTNMGKLMDGIYSACSQVEHLQKVLEKKRDPVTHVCFIDTLLKNGQTSIAQSFWESITQILTEEFGKAADNSSFLKQAFEGEYPKLLRLYNDLWQRLQQFTAKLSAASPQDSPTSDIQSTRISDSNFSPEEAMRRSLTPFENAYLSRSLSRLFDPINLAFSSPSGAPPTQEEIDGITRTISSELIVSNVDSKLSVKIAKNVSKTIQLIAVKSEQLLSTDDDAVQVIAPANHSQRNNAAVVNMLYRTHKSLNKVIGGLSGFPDLAMTHMKTSLQSLSALMSTAIQPLLSAVSHAIESILLTMHMEDFSQGSSKDDSEKPQCSLYMRELQTFLSRVNSDYLMMYECTELVMDSVHPVACRCIELFIRHVSLIRPLGDGGRMRLAADFAQMEAAISPLCYRIGDLGKAYKQLRSFRPLLFQNADHIAGSSSLGEVVPQSTALCFLFSRSPAELLSPHQKAEWTEAEYSKWLDQHPSEKDRLLLIKATLESYVQTVKARQGKEFAPVYPTMLKLLNEGMQKS